MNPNEAIIRRWFEDLWNQKRIETIDELYTEDTVAHGMGDGGLPVRGREAFRQVFQLFTGAFPDLLIGIDRILTDGDYVATHYTVRATHSGDHLGFPATGRTVKFSGMTMAHIRHGKIVEGWNTIDFLAMLQQVGAAPKLTEFKLLP